MLVFIVPSQINCCSLVIAGSITAAGRGNEEVFLQNSHHKLVTNANFLRQ